VTVATTAIYSFLNMLPCLDEASTANQIHGNRGQETIEA